MTDAQRRAAILKIIEERTEQMTVSQKAARDALIKEGIYTQRGELRVEFGGGTKKKVKVAG